MVRIARWLWDEVVTDVLIVADLGLGFLTWLLVAGLVPGDRVNFNVAGSLAVIAVCTVPWWLLDRYVQRRLGYRN